MPTIYGGLGQFAASAGAITLAPSNLEAYQFEKRPWRMPLWGYIWIMQRFTRLL